jgi:hypothetical protein
MNSHSLSVSVRASSNPALEAAHATASEAKPTACRPAAARAVRAALGGRSLRSPQPGQRITAPRPIDIEWPP